MVWACANGGDPSADDGDPGLPEAGSSGGHDSGSGGSSGSSSGGGSGSSSGARDSGSSGNEASVTPDASSVDSSDPQESSTTQEASTADTGSGQDTGVVMNGVCPSGGKYAVEAAAAVLSGSPTICLVPNCPAGDCCYEQVSPFNVCVAE